jgi:hypothetical protein
MLLVRRGMLVQHFLAVAGGYSADEGSGRQPRDVDCCRAAGNLRDCNDERTSCFAQFDHARPLWRAAIARISGRVGDLKATPGALRWRVAAKPRCVVIFISTQGEALGCASMFQENCDVTCYVSEIGFGCLGGESARRRGDCRRAGGRDHGGLLLRRQLHVRVVRLRRHVVQRLQLRQLQLQRVRLWRRLRQDCVDTPFVA